MLFFLSGCKDKGEQVTGKLFLKLISQRFAKTPVRKGFAG